MADVLKRRGPATATISDVLHLWEGDGVDRSLVHSLWCRFIYLGDFPQTKRAELVFSRFITNGV